MNNPKGSVPLTWLGIGIVVGVILALILIYVLGATPNEVSVGPIKFRLPIAAPLTSEPVEPAPEPALSGDISTVEVAQIVERPVVQTVVVEKSVPQTVIVEKEVTKVVTIPVTVVVKETVEKLITVPVQQTAIVVVAPSPIPTLPPPAIPLPFEDNFDAGLTDVWEQTSGNWTMVDGHLTTTGPQPPQSIIMTGDTSWTDYAIEYDLRANWRDRGVNRVILRDSGGEQMAFEFSDGRNSARLLYVKDRQAKVIAEGSVGFLDIQPPFSVRVEAKGDIYRLFTSGVLHMTVQDDTLTHGRVGFYEAGTGAWFDNFKVSALP
jgi:hypothetical protein